jgi:ATP-dependent RNA helicase SUPV3L1/SUV3
LNTEIGKTGEVIVEGHVIGRLDGFTFAPDAAEAGSDAKALQATAQKALAGEIDARAEKLAAAPDDQFVLTSDGTIRWTGDAVAKLVAADDALHPRLRIISDERLNGAPREAVQTRLDLWLKTHIEKLLGPLFELSRAEDVTGIARGIAFQLIEALGVLERQKISAEMKDLDQPSRASLRKYGVRFGAYHIYVPPLLKPAARALASLLWALKQDNVDMSALSGAQHLAGSGRTSFPVDKALHRDAYRVLGYRQCGERAVRVDILERLADLIRPALAWRETSPGAKPAGAFDGRSFVVTQAMTSLTGSAGEDFASVLRALGYRMERRPPPPPKPVVVETPAAEAAPVEVEAAPAETEAAPAEATPAESAAEASSETAVESVTESVTAPVAEATVATADTAIDAPAATEAIAASSATLLPEVAFAPEPATPEPSAPEPSASEPVAVETKPELEIVAEAAAEPVTAEAPSQDQAATETPAETATTVETAAVGDAAPADATAAAAPAEPELLEVWRPGGRSDERRPPRHDRSHDRNRHRRPDRPAEAAQPAVAGEAAAGEAADGARRERHRHGRRDRHQDFRKPRTDAPPAEGVAAAAVDAAPVGEPRQDQGRPSRERFEGKGRTEDRNKGKFRGDRDKGGRDNGGRDKGGRDKGGRDKGGRDRDKGGRESGPSHRQYATSAGPRERDRPIDPNSPFAKLAALKEQLAANRKD